MSSKPTPLAYYRALAKSQSQTQPTTSNLSHFQCDDKSHDAYRHTTDLEARIRHNCDLPKIQTVTKDDKGWSVTKIVHRAAVTQTMVDDCHEKAEVRWKKVGGKKVGMAGHKLEDKTITDRAELEGDEWEVIDDADVDDSSEGRGKSSGKQVWAVGGGLQ